MKPSDLKSKINQAKSMIEKAQIISVFSGAGMSADSGVPTFRGSKGLWNGLSSEELASIDGFQKNPDLVLNWYAERREKLYPLQPNDGHRALASLEKNKEQLRIVTQNVDNFHRQVGHQHIVELHGNLWIDRCSSCDWQKNVRDDWPLEAKQSCPSCGQLRRPGVVWFGEALPDGAIEKASTWIASSDLLMVIGTSATVYPAAGLIPFAKQQGIPVLEICLEPSQASDICDLNVTGKSAEVLPQLIEN